MKLWPSPSHFDATPTPVMKSIRINGYKRVPGFDFVRHLKFIQMAALLCSGLNGRTFAGVTIKSGVVCSERRGYLCTSAREIRGLRDFIDELADLIARGSGANCCDDARYGCVVSVAEDCHQFVQERGIIIQFVLAAFTAVARSAVVFVVSYRWVTLACCPSHLPI